MPQGFLFPRRDQPLLLPVGVMGPLPGGDLVFVVLDAVAALDVGGSGRRYRAGGHGRAASGPQMMAALLLYGCCQGERPGQVTGRRRVPEAGYRCSPAGCAPVMRPLPGSGRGMSGRWAGCPARRWPCWPRASITGPGVPVMRSQKGYVAGGNGQLAATADQVSTGAMPSQHPAGPTLLHPLVDQRRGQLAAAGIRPELRTVPAGAGYASEENPARAGQHQPRPPAPLAKDPAGQAGAFPKKPGTWARTRPPPAPSGACGIPAAGRDYTLRARTAEPVPRQLTTCQNLTTMSRRGLPACHRQWLPACTAHNLPKPHRHHLQGYRSKAPRPAAKTHGRHPRPSPRTPYPHPGITDLP